MRLSLDWKVLLSSFLISIGGFSQTLLDSTSKIEDFKQNLVVYTDLGFNSAPFTIGYPFSADIDQLNYKNNFKTFLGLGIAYRWFSLRVGFPILSSYRPTAKYGSTKQFNFGFDFSFLKTYYDLEFKYLEGYSLQKALLTGRKWTYSNQVGLMMENLK